MRDGRVFIDLRSLLGGRRLVLLLFLDLSNTTDMAAHSTRSSHEVAVMAHATDGHMTADMTALGARSPLEVAVPTHATDGRLHRAVSPRRASAAYRPCM